jgi:farnesyl diphosphate synthase
LNAYAYDVGLAFQIIDDLLDIDGDPKELGKATNKDMKAGKATFVSLLGAERARDQAEILTVQAIENLEIFGEKADLLRDLARFVIERHK